MPVLNSIQRAMGVPKNTNQPVVTAQNSIANDFLRRGAVKTLARLDLDKQYDPEATIKGYLYAALNFRKESFAEYAEENVVCEDKHNEGLKHPYLELIENSKVEDEYEFWRDLINDYDMTGESFIFLLRRVVYSDDAKPGEKRTPTHIGMPTAIEQLDSKRMTILRNARNQIVGYRERLDGNHVREFLPEQIIRIYNKHPLDPDRVLSVFDACKDYQYTINKGSEFAQSALLNNTNSPGIVSTETTMTQEEYDDLIARLNGHEPGKWIVTDGASKLSYTPLSQDLDSVALPSLTEVNRQTIFAVTGTSKTILGIEESGTTRDTARVQEQKFTKRTIKPLVKRFLSALNFDYRTCYPERYKLQELKLVLKSGVDAAEELERYQAQKTLFDDTLEIVYSGYNAESAQAFMNGEIDFTEMRVDGHDADEIDQESENQDGDPDTDAGDDGDGDGGGSNNPSSSNGLTEQELAQVDVENQTSHIHDEVITDNYIDKALGQHIIEGELTEYGQQVKTQAIKAKNDLLKTVRKIQLDAIKDASARLEVNEFDYRDIRSKEDEEGIFTRLFNAFKKYWLFMVPLIGRERLAEDKEVVGLSAPVNLLGTRSVQNYIKDISKREAESHTKTIYDSILEASNKAAEKATADLFADEYLKEYKQGEDKWFKTKPTKKQVKSKLKNEQFLSENEKMYKWVQDRIAEGYNRAEIQRMVRREYVDLSRKRANVLVGNEMAKAINSSQFMADYELLAATNSLNKAYKRLVSNSGHPCPICEEIINRGEIPFTENFVELGDTVQATKENGQTQVMVFNYEPIRDGVVHPNCRCSYQLVIKES